MNDRRPRWRSHGNRLTGAHLDVATRHPPALHVVSQSAAAAAAAGDEDEDEDEDDLQIIVYGRQFISLRVHVRHDARQVVLTDTQVNFRQVSCV